MKTSIKNLSLLASAALLTFSSLSAVSTQPVGYTTWTIEAGTGTGRALTPLAIPLYSASDISGDESGVIDSITSNTITVSGAGWSPGELSAVESPYLVRITSGLAAGRNLLISTDSNTTESLTIDLLTSDIDSLLDLGIDVGADTFEIIECDTLLSMFGSPSDGAIIGGSDFDSADNIWLLDANGIWNKYYYDTDTSEWVQNIRGFPNKDHMPLLPDYGILVYRLSNQSSELVITGTVPNTPRDVTVNKGGLTFFGNAFPVDMTLAEAGFEDVPGWVSSSDASVADLVFIRDSGAWKRCFHNGTEWVQNVRGFPVADSFLIKSGTSVFLQKSNALGQDVDFNQLLPYSL